MSEPDKPGEAVDNTTAAPTAEPTATDSATENKATEPANGQADAGKKEEAKPSDKSHEGTPPPNSGEQEFKPKSRNSASARIKQVVSERDDWKSKYEALAAKQAGKEGDDGDPQPDDNKPNATDPKDISSEVARQLEPVLSQHRQQVDDTELAELFAGDNAGKKAVYEPKIREAWKLDQYKGLAASDLLKILDYDTAVANAKRQGVEEFKKAEQEAREASGAGNNNTINRTGKGGSPAAQMTDEELIAHNNRVKAGIVT
jgi:hypothetical protein